MHYFVTGHTGFKGSWLTLLLRRRGHLVSGLSLDPLENSLFVRADLSQELRHDIRADVRNAGAVANALAVTRPDVVVHMAAQPLVRESLRDPRTTVETNVMGTLNVLEAVQAAKTVRAHLVVTTDKVYRNVDQLWGYREEDALGGDDPYSASKAMVEILTQSWTSSFRDCRTATARAGNVIGGGDVSRDRLLPDLIAAMTAGRVPLIRNPTAVRPWQHVLDAVNGYAALIDAMLNGEVHESAWNFGPESSSFLTVGEVADRVAALWGSGATWVRDSGEHPAEADQLTLDARQAVVRLGWRPALDIDQALAWTVEWAKRVRDGDSPAAVTRSQVDTFDGKG
jgi:CDP-glucose 4,6-dehydratase